MKGVFIRLLGYRDVLGWHGIAGILLVLFSVTFYVASIIPSLSTVKKINETATQIQLNQMRTSTNSPIHKLNTNASLGDIYKNFPPQDEVAEILSKIYSMAKNSKITLEHGTYKKIIDKTSPFSKYEIEFPIKGKYSEIQLFTSRILNNIPAIALNQISFKRETINDTNIQSKLFFTLYILNK